MAEIDLEGLEARAQRRHFRTGRREIFALIALVKTYRQRAFDAEAGRNRVRRLAEEMKADADKVLARDPVESGTSFGEQYEAGLELAVAERVLATLNGKAAADA